MKEDYLDSRIKKYINSVQNLFNFISHFNARLTFGDL